MNVTLQEERLIKLLRKNVITRKSVHVIQETDTGLEILQLHFSLGDIGGTDTICKICNEDKGKYVIYGVCLDCLIKKWNGEIKISPIHTPDAFYCKGCRYNENK